MATTEDELRNGAIALIKKYGRLTTNEVKKHMEEVISFDEDDLKKSKSRNEIAITQRIGNIVSHQKEDKKIYFDSYEIDKTKKPATWTDLTGLVSNETIKPISEASVTLRRKEANKFKARKIDWKTINSTRSSLGIKGEEFVEKKEIGRIIKFAANDTSRVVHVSQTQGDGLGYDILSLNEDGTDRYIEVKTTTEGEKTPFYLSINEKRFFEVHKNDNSAYIYRVYNFNIENGSADFKVISAKELFSNYSIDPINFYVSYKWKKKRF